MNHSLGSTDQSRMPSSTAKPPRGEAGGLGGQPCVETLRRYKTRTFAPAHAGCRLPLTWAALGRSFGAACMMGLQGGSTLATHPRYFSIHQCLAARWRAPEVVAGLQGHVSSGTLSTAPCSTSRCGVSPERIACTAAAAAAGSHRPTGRLQAQLA
jgi:hypothetical protein